MSEFGGLWNWKEENWFFQCAHIYIYIYIYIYIIYLCIQVFVQYEYKVHSFKSHLFILFIHVNTLTDIKMWCKCFTMTTIA